MSAGLGSNLPKRFEQLELVIRINPVFRRTCTLWLGEFAENLIDSLILSLVDALATGCTVARSRGVIGVAAGRGCL